MRKGKTSKRDQQKAILENQEVLAAELTYLGQTAFQTNEDRQRVAQFFFISFGSFLAAILSLQIETVSQNDIFLILGFVFLFVTLFGISTLLQLTRLRLAWLESVLAMNRLKAHIQEAHSPALDDVFAWLDVPAAYKPGSVGYYQAIQVALGTGVALGAAAAFFMLVLQVGLSLGSVVLLGIALGMVAASMLFNRLYRKALDA